MARRGRPPADDVLTPGEWRVTEAVRHGLSNPQIAERLGTSTDAVKYHVANALQKLGLRTRRELRHWDGIARHSRMAQRRQDMGSTTIGVLGQVSRSVRDIEAATHWYGTVLGLEHLYRFGKLAFFACGEVRLLLSEGDGGAADSILYFRVEDIHETVRALGARGAEFINAPHRVHTHADGTEEWMAFFRDNEGRPLALMAQLAGGDGG